MITIFPFLIGYDKISAYILTITNGTPVSTDIMIITWILINWINIWFILKIAKIIMKHFKWIIKKLI